MDLGLNHVTRKFADAVDHSYLFFLKVKQKNRRVVTLAGWLVGWLVGGFFFFKLMIQQKSPRDFFVLDFLNQALLYMKIYMYKWVEIVGMTYD